MQKLTDESCRRGVDIFATYDELLEKTGLVGIPVVRNDKKPVIRGWGASAACTPKERQLRRSRYRDMSIGLLAGSKLTTGRFLGFVDIDVEGLVAFAIAVLGEPVSAKRGEKGLTIFVQTDDLRAVEKLKFRGRRKAAVEIFTGQGQTVLPPSPHPAGMQYRWLGTPIYEVRHELLPVLTAEKLEFMRATLGREEVLAIVESGADVRAHDLMLSLTASGIAELSDDLEWMARCLNALFHPDYRGNTKDETLGMLRTAKKKGLGARKRRNLAYEPGEKGPIPLGFTKEGLFALRDPVRSIILQASPNQLLSMQYQLGLASLDFWASQFPVSKGLFDFIGAGLALLEMGRRAGPFNPLKVRGRGVWREGNRIILNFGDVVPAKLGYQYLCFEPIRFAQAESFHTGRLLEMLKLFKWRNEQDAVLLLGWLAIAPICGVLEWRPHCFLYGPPRCGKTTIHGLAARLLHPLVISTDGQSSEAGIRQTLGPDSLPIIIDEFESDQHSAGLRGVIRLARSASSSDNPVLRGTPEGKAMQFSLRTTFFFSAVNPTNLSQADESRILQFEMMMHDNDDGVARRILAEEAFFRERGIEWCGYMVSLASVVSPAIERFERAMPGLDRRHRKNIATLLAGAFIALERREPTDDEADAWAAEFGSTVTLHAESLERDDAMEALDHLFSFVVDDYPLGHWLALLLAAPSRTGTDRSPAHRITRTYDLVIKSEGEAPGLFIRNGSPAISRVFQGTIWEGRGWEKAIRKLEGAFRAERPLYFSSAVGKGRAIGIPLRYIPKPIDDWIKF